MKAKDIWTMRFYCEYNELDSLAEFLEAKIASGWELTSYKGASFGFRKAEPRNVQISVELVDDADDEAAKKRFIEYCEADGWKHIFDGGKLQFFEHEDLDAEPIHTDAEVKLKMVHRKCLTSRCVFNIVGAALISLYVVHTAFSLSYHNLFQSFTAIVLFFFPILALLLILSTVDYLLWYRRAKSAIERGREPTYRRTKVSKIIDKIAVFLTMMNIWGCIILDAFYAKSTIVLIVAALFMLGTGLFTFFYERREARYNKDGQQHLGQFIAFAIVFVLTLSSVAYLFIGDLDDYGRNGDVLISVEELGVTSDGSRESWAYNEGSPLVQYEDGHDRYGSQRISYELFSTRFTKVYEDILQKRFFAFDDTYEEAFDSAFGANKVYLMGQAAGLIQWLLLYDEDILYLETNNIDLTDEQKAVVASKFAD